MLRSSQLSLVATPVVFLAVAQAGISQDMTTLQASRQIGDQTQLAVEATFAAGEFRVSPASRGQLYSIRMEYDDEVIEPIHEFQNNRLVVGVEGMDGGSFFRRGRPNGELDLALTTELPMELDLQFGAVRAELELGGLRLRSLRLATGASDAEVQVSAPNPEPMGSIELEIGAASFTASDLGRLNAESVSLQAGVGSVELDFGGLRREETRVDIEMGLGSVEIRVPREAGIRLTRESFLTALEAPDLVRDENEFLSENWESSQIRMLIDVEAAFGKITVVRTN